ncbi:putative cAMP specific phosphodiesterase [Leptomonas pyrrhocoris]|uniref:Phosphodiesterase n=1 Tax=Leptomonas pyrrhocoris TaxID=157538 RepID=A0A0M9FSB9_LEPPY|nr:putative cAMP specific phosphodiesterase [Leptomonas pyrrhocoris]KPA75033.1 putative cAMP specific phosphodiesterase [Leptomonas pyrrhocoris]|eukprot:XP_015653472.1 putative cAMP specific phosphodiesterase [Leptomonas pyrrhocoris]
MLAYSAMRAPPARDYTFGSSHLLEALSLCESILARYKRCGLAMSDAELNSFHSVQRRVSAVSDEAYKDPMDSVQAQEKATSSRHSLRDFTKLAQNCLNLQRSISETALILNKELTTLFGCPAHTNYLNESENVLCDPVTEAITAMDTCTQLGACGVSRQRFSSPGATFLPLLHQNDLVGCVELSGQVTNSNDTFQQCALRVAASALRNAVLVDQLSWETHKAEAMVGMATRLARDTLDEAVLVQSIINTAKTLTESDRCSIFLVKDDGTLEAHFEDGKVVVMAAGTGIAGYVAKTGMVVNIPNAYEDERFNRAVDKQTGYHTRTILCLPIMYEDTIVAVAQLINKQDMVTESGLRLQRVFGQRDEELFKTFSMFAAASLRNCRINETLLTEKRKSDAILDVVTLLSNTDIRDVDGIVRHVLHGAKKLLNADRSSLFLLDKERNELYSRMADSVTGSEIRFPCGQGIAGTVAAAAVGENIVDAYADPRFNSAVDRSLGYRTQSILCEPIVLNNDVLAVVQLVNKLDEDGTVKSFTAADRATFKVFSLFAGISINNSHLFEFAVKAGQEAMALNLHRTIAPVGAQKSNNAPKLFDISKVERDAVLAIDFQDAYDFTSPAFNLFDVRENSSEPLDAAAAVVLQLLWSTGLPEKFKCRKETLLTFILQCRHMYRRVPYHNFYHVVDVCQTLHTFLYAGKASEFLTDLECYVLLVTALVHDLDHMGVNNSFYLKTDSPLGILSSASGNSSVLEVHHCRLAIEILSEPSSDVFEGLTEEEVTYAYQSLIECVLATDMAKHGEELKRFDDMVQASFNKEDEGHRRLVMETLIKAGDVSNVTKPFETSRMWAMAVTEEFYRQGDMEKEKGVEVLPMFDRSKNTELARGQIGFIDFVVGKYFKDIVGGLLHGMQWCVDAIADNRAQWQKILDAPKRDSLTSV